MSLSSLVEIYRYVLQPAAPFTYFGLGVSTLDLAATFRLCIALRQIREALHAQHVAKHKGSARVNTEDRSFVRDAATTLLVVYGGEAVMCPYLGIPPSFVVSGVGPALYIAVQALVERFPAVPAPSIHTELPLAIMDGFARAFLLCSLIPPTVTTNTLPALSSSPWALLITSLLTANAGFLLTNMTSLLHPTSISLTTPVELLPYGWSTTDVWCAPLITALYATLTHAQPFWTDVHSVALGWLGAGGTWGSLDGEGKAGPVDAEVARAACAGLLAMMFVTRAVKNFGGEWIDSVQGTSKKVVSGPKPGLKPKVKTQ